MIKNLIFDIGGVLIGYRWQNMLKDYGLNEDAAERVGMEIFNDPLWRDYDRGIISTENLIKDYAAKYPNDSVHIEFFIRNCGLIKVNRPETWKKVEVLKNKGYKIYLLSNYSEELVKIHVKDMYIYNMVDGKVISYEVNSIKPEEDIYKALLTKYKLIPQESLFFDDRQDNIDTAVSLGIDSIRIESEDHINQILDDLILNN